MVTIMAIYGHTLWPYMAIYLWPLWIWEFKNQFPYMAILWYGMAIYGNTPLLSCLCLVFLTIFIEVDTHFGLLRG